MFGQSKPGFSTGTFGQTSAFGSTTPFGGGSNTSSTFGAKQTGTATFGPTGGFGNQTPATGGLFGNTSTQNTSGIFGGGTSTGFGQTQNTSFGGFGTQTSQASGMFGQSQPQASNIFGTPQPTSAFGTKTPAPGAFGATQNTGGLFGASTGGSALFGGSTNTPSAGGLFGAGGAFGASNAQAGTTIKFNPLSGTDTVLKSGVSQSINTRHQCITAMKEYENKSLEELRMEDYSANRKGPQAGGTTTGLFGAQNAQQSSGFGFGGQQQQQQQNKPAGFGFGNNNTTQATGLFSNQQSGGLFGSTANKGLFGATTTTASSTASGGFGFGQTNTSQSGGLFGANQQKPLFGAATTQSGGGLFGQTQTSSAFGTSGGTSFGTFGTNTQATSGGLFGANKPAFGAATSTAGGLGFGQQNTGGLFGNKPATAGAGFNFGQTPNTGFGATQSSGLFGTKPGGFGATTGGLGTTGGFGAGLTAGNSLFTGQQNKLTLGSAFTPGTGLGTLGGSTLGAGLTLGGSTTSALGAGADAAAAIAQQAQIQQQLLVLSNSPYGESPLFKNLKPDENKREDALKPTNPAAQKAALTAANQYKVSPRPTAKIKPKPLQSLNNKSQLFDGLDEEESTFGNDTFVPRKSIKKLVIKNLRSPNSSMLNGSHNKSQLDPDSSALVAPSPIMAPSNVPDQLNGEVENIQSPAINGETNIIRGRKALNTSVNNTPIRNKYGGMGLDDTITALNPHSRSANELDRSRLSSAGEEEEQEEEEESRPHPAGIKLTRPGYYTLPPLEELGTLVDECGACWVEDLVIGREGYGNVFFPGLTNIAGLNLDSIVHFRRKEITVYPDDDKKPSVGSGLNKKAQVTLDCVWPNDKSLHTPIKSPERLSMMNYQEKIEQATNKIGAKFVDYRPETGSWVFEVRHFSKYGLLDDSEDEADLPENDPKRLKLLQLKTQQQLAIQKKKVNQEAEAMEEGAMAAGGELPSPVLGGVPTMSPLVGAEVGSVQAIPRPRLTEEADDEDDDDSNMEDLMQEEMPDDGDLGPISEMSECPEDHTPASHRLASHLGVSSQTVQVMKASFFDDEDDMDTDSSLEPMKRGLGGPLLRGPHRSAPMVVHPLDLPVKKPRGVSSSPSIASSSPTPAQTLPRSFLYDRIQTQQPVRPALKPFHQKVPDHIILPSGLDTGEKPRKLVGSRIQRAVPALEDSITANKDHMLMDKALFRGRTCRASWAPGFTLVHCGNPINHTPIDMPEKPSILPRLMGSHRRRLDESPFEVVVEKVNITGYSTEADPALKNMLEKTLEIQLKHSQMSCESGFPVFVPSPGVASLHRCAEQAAEDEERVANHPYAPTVHHTHMVWDLCVALWGNLHQFMDREEPEAGSHEVHMARREAFSRWLSSTAARKIKQEINHAKVKGLGHLHGVRSYMTARMISDACALSQESGDHRLAMVLAQSAGSHISRKLIARQLAKWEELKADQFIEPDRLQLYTLLAGTMVWPSSEGDINVCEGLDWKRCLAVHLWYLCTPTATIAEALSLYDKAFSGATPHGRYASLPLPPYLEDSVDKLYMEEEEEGERYAVRDMCYHLLRLYSERSHRLERILTPTTSTPNHLDFTLSWHLMQVLQALQYTHLSKYAEASVTSGFAAQLEALGLWHWAVFVLLHIEDPVSREHTVRGLLGRHVSLSRDADYVDREHFILERLEVPPVWIHEAKAQRARSEGRSPEEAWHLVKAGRWNQAHRILLRHVSADAIINERYGFLKRYLREMAPPEYSSSIQDWATGGKVFLDYITMMETLDEIKQGDLNAYELERLQPEVTSLCSRIEHLPCFTAKDRLCQSEMAKRTANLLRMLLLLQQSRTEPHRTHLSSRLIAPHITKLPLPEDYALQELRQLTRAHMIEMTS